MSQERSILQAAVSVQRLAGEHQDQSALTLKKSFAQERAGGQGAGLM